MVSGGRANFSLISLKNSTDCLHENANSSRGGETTRVGELSRLGRKGNPVRRDNFFSYKHFGSPTRGEMAQIVFFTITAKFSRTHWLIFIVNKRTDT